MTAPGGIVAIRVSNSAGGIEIDHVQTDAGVSAVPVGPLALGLLTLAVGLVGACRLARSHARSSQRR